MASFERLFGNPATRELTADWVEGYRARRPVRVAPWIILAPVEVPLEPRQVPEPHVIQQAALQALDRTRAAGHTAGLVVLATGLGKTWLSAFDSNRAEYRRILFIAHREEILDQAIKTFRQIRPEARIGE